MKKLGFSLALAAALALPPASQAKTLTSATVCGPDACTTVTDRNDLGALISSIERDESATSEAASPAPFYKVHYKLGDGGFDVFYVPAAQKARPVDSTGITWWDLEPAAAEAFGRATKGLAPFASPRLRSVTVVGRKVKDPDAYLFLFDRLSAALVAPATAGKWVEIQVVPDRPNPWIGEAQILTHQQGTNVINDNGPRRLPHGKAAQIERAAGLPVTAGAGFAWRAPAVGLALVAAALAVAFALARRMPRRAPKPA